MTIDQGAMLLEHDQIWTKDKDEGDAEREGEVISEPETPTVKCQASLPPTEWSLTQQQ